MTDLSQLVKAYDVRGVVPDQWDEGLAELFGAAFVTVTQADAIVTGYDMRPSSPGLSRAFARGAAARGASVTEIGLCSTDELYFASGRLDLPGAMFTASHNPSSPPPATTSTRTAPSPYAPPRTTTARAARAS